jgi:hypothetical protein
LYVADDVQIPNASPMNVYVGSMEYGRVTSDVFEDTMRHSFNHAVPQCTDKCGSEVVPGTPYALLVPLI